jgi:beta-lactamase class D
MSVTEAEEQIGGTSTRLDRRQVLATLVAGGLVGAAERSSSAAPAHRRARDKQVEVREDLEAVFREAGLTGCFALYDPSETRLVVVNRTRAEQRRVPASTYKIPHSLIALETGVVSSPEEILPYGGKPAFVKAWERDMSLREAIRLSNVPIYQGIARRIGRERMQSWVDRLGYGNRRLGKVVDQFWLVGPLQISAVEQVRFLARLARTELPASRRNQELVGDLLRIEKTPGYELFAKTGWAMDLKPQVGWWVGWVEKDGRPYAFALNADLASQADADRRLLLGRELLHRLGVI